MGGVRGRVVVQVRVEVRKRSEGKEGRERVGEELGFGSRETEDSKEWLNFGKSFGWENFGLGMRGRVQIVTVRLR